MAAALLARRRIPTVVFDDEKRPALLVGESLVPAIVPYLRELEIEERVAAISLHKPGVSFLHRGTLEMHFNFQSVAGILPTYAYNVPRPEFDDVLRQRAVELGVRFIKHRARLTAHPGDTTTELRLDNESLTAAGFANGEAPALILDAAGRARLSARALGIGAQTGPRRDQAHFAHYTGFAHPFPEGQVAITYHSFGWSWRIPLRDRLSFGVVMSSAHAAGWGNTPEARLERVLAEEPRLAPSAQTARRITDVFTYNNYQLISDRGHGPGWAAIGDAFGFVDPMLSPGVFLALESAASVARIACDHLQNPARLGHELARHERAMRDWLTAWQELIGYFYDGRIASFYQEGTAMKQKHPGAFSNFMERRTARRIACMASGATTRSTWHRQCLRHSIRWLTAESQHGEYAVP